MAHIIYPIDLGKFHKPPIVGPPFFGGEGEYCFDLRIFGPPKSQDTLRQSKGFGDVERNPCQAFLHPGKLTWNLKVTQLKRNIICQIFIFGFQGLSTQKKVIVLRRNLHRVRMNGLITG